MSCHKWHARNGSKCTFKSSFLWNNKWWSNNSLHKEFLLPLTWCEGTEVNGECLYVGMFDQFALQVMREPRDNLYQSNACHISLNTQWSGILHDEITINTHSSWLCSTVHFTASLPNMKISTEYAHYGGIQMSEIYQCKILGSKDGGGCLPEGSLLMNTYYCW